jgi:hypothetical protein
MNAAQEKVAVAKSKLAAIYTLGTDKAREYEILNTKQWKAIHDNANEGLRFVDI